MRAETAIVVEARGLGKRFKLFDRPRHRLLEWAAFGLRRFHRELWVLRDISLAVRRGEAFGVIGRNGTGKTTLLRLLSKGLRPSEGECRHEGRLLSVAGFGGMLTPSLTGRQNVQLICDLLGLPREFVPANIDAIEGFAEIGQFFDQPVSRISSGMRTRIGFAIAVAVRPDVLLLDEALTAGDEAFAERCDERLARMLEEGAAVIMATHNLEAIRRYCRQALVLDYGASAWAGPAEKAIDRYRGRIAKSSLLEAR